MVEIAVGWLSAGLESDTAEVLAGETHPILSDAQPMFEQALAELNTTTPSKEEAVPLVLIEYLKRIVSGAIAPFDGMRTIDQDIYHAVWTEGCEDYVGAVIGAEHMYTWFRELQDAADGSLILYYTNLPKKKQVAKFTQHLREEAEKLLKKLETQQSSRHVPK